MHKLEASVVITNKLFINLNFESGKCFLLPQGAPRGTEKMKNLLHIVQKKTDTVQQIKILNKAFS
jgi:hypothetical protein